MTPVRSRDDDVIAIVADDVIGYVIITGDVISDDADADDVISYVTDDVISDSGDVDADDVISGNDDAVADDVISDNADDVTRPIMHRTITLTATPLNPEMGA
ncbi:hypothetical protein ISCGN_028451 [Ixodes scapularis]